MQEPHTIFPQVLPRNVENSSTDNDSTLGDQVYELVNNGKDSNTNKFAKNRAYYKHNVKRRKQRKIWIIIVTSIMVLSLSACIAVHCIQPHKSMPSNSRYEKMPDTNRTSTTAFKPKMEYAKKNVAFVQVVGSGNRHLTLRQDERFSHWKLEKKSGKVTFKSLTYIIVQQSGTYQVYAQVTFKTRGADSSASIMLVRNRSVLSKSLAENCLHVCTMYTSKLVTLNRGDYLYLKAGKDSEFIMDPKFTYFGAISV